MSDMSEPSHVEHDAVREDIESLDYDINASTIFEQAKEAHALRSHLSVEVLPHHGTRSSGVVEAASISPQTIRTPTPSVSLPLLIPFALHHTHPARLQNAGRWIVCIATGCFVGALAFIIDTGTDHLIDLRWKVRCAGCAEWSA